MFADSSTIALMMTALVIGITHTILGPDHYLPFVALSKARRWSHARTLLVTLVCGLGHVAGSVLIGALGLAVGWSLGGLEAVESIRGELAAWLLTALGGLYLAWAVKNLGRKRTHTHIHAHADGTLHSHQHHHAGSHAHPHLNRREARSVTAWSLFIIFVFGPCEAFIPLLLFPAVQQNLPVAVSTTLVFAVATVATMLGMVYLLVRGIEFLPLKRYSRFGHVAAGLTILACGMAIHLGL